MNANKIPSNESAKTISINDSLWNDAPFTTLRSSEALLQRLRYIVHRASQEAWLPAELRKEIYNSVLQAHHRDRRGELTPFYAQSLVEQLASSSYQYDDHTLSSPTLCQIRTLDMELNEYRYLQANRHPFAGEDRYA